MLLSLVLRVQSWTFSLGNTFLHISLGCLGSHTRSFQTIYNTNAVVMLNSKSTDSFFITKNNLSCKLGGKKFAIQYVIWCLPAIEQPLGRLGWSRRLLLMMILSLRHVSNSLRPENGRGVKADVLLLPIIKRDLGIINLKMQRDCNHHQAIRIIFGKLKRFSFCTIYIQSWYN